MHILHLYKDYHPVLGGIENHIKVLAEAQAAAGHHVTVLVCDPGLRTRTEIVEGVEVFKAGRLTTAASMPLSLAQPLALARLRLDIVHLHSPYPLGEVANWLLGRAKATVITHHSDVVRQRKWLRLYGWGLRRILAAAGQIIATSPRYIATSPWLSPLREKCRVIPLGVDTARFTPIRSPHNHPPDILFVGRLRYYKGLDTLLNALMYVPQARLTVVGEGPMKLTWQALSRQLGLANRVAFVGQVDDSKLPDYYRQAQLFVLPADARAEAFGMVLLEAMACGVPCITTELGTGTSWIVQNGVTGFVVQPKDPLALAKAINDLLNNEALRFQFARAALARVRTDFSQQVMVKRVMQVYEDLLIASRNHRTIAKIHRAPYEESSV